MTFPLESNSTIFWEFHTGSPSMVREYVTTAVFQSSAFIPALVRDSPLLKPITGDNASSEDRLFSFKKEFAFEIDSLLVCGKLDLALYFWNEITEASFLNDKIIVFCVGIVCEIGVLSLSDTS